MSDIFPRIHAFVLSMEGGYVNHPNDPGGATNFGVSLRWLRSLGYDVNGDGVIDLRDIKALTPQHSLELFREQFWEKPKLHHLPPLVAAVLYDGGINMGASRAIKQLQKACNAFQGGPLLQVDGRIGPATVQRVRQFCATPAQELTLCRSVLNLREEYYRQLASREPFTRNGQLVDYRHFLRGWLNRTAALWAWLNTYSKGGNNE